MTILIILAILLFIGLLLSRSRGYDAEIAGIILSVLSGVLLFFALLGIPLNRLEINGQIQEFYAIADTARNARESDDGMESAAYRLKIAEANQWLAKSQYWAGTTFWIYFPDAIKELEPIE